MEYKPGKTIFDASVFTSRPLIREIIMLEFSGELLRLGPEGSVGPTACKTSLSSSGESTLHHAIVRSADINVETGKLNITVWPLLSYGGSNLRASDGMSMIKALTDESVKNMFLPVKFAPSVKYAYVNSKEYLEISTPEKFKKTDDNGGPVNMGSYLSKFPAWIVMDLHCEEFSSGRMFARLHGVPRVPPETMDRLDVYFAELTCPETLTNQAQVMPLREDEELSDGDNLLSSFVGFCSFDKRDRIVDWINAL